MYENKGKRNFERKESGNRDFKKREPGRRDSGKREAFRSSEVRGDFNAPVQEDEVQETLEGRNSVIEALKSDRAINKILVSKGDKEGSIKQIFGLARDKGIVVQEVERQKLDSISSTNAHQGVVAFVSPMNYVEVEDILQAAASKGEPPFIIVLDEIADPHNLGSILRTADAVGVHGVIIPKRRAVGLTAVVSKASAGAIEYVPVARVTNIVQTIDNLKKQNIWIVGTDSSGDKPFYESDMKGAIALVIGSEGEGMGRLVRESCDFTVNIPMQGKISSLNASVAAAIVMYEIKKQRSK
ncbi:MAG: 23S rRNA (guanosine(2251)-2'-O)-methyltransferase RlmB [Bacillota bacterium]|nr:23S rRNA (guanosine(2251)-2'-O)-methyltransferase RlmB [Bacillota bacterium]